MKKKRIKVVNPRAQFSALRFSPLASRLDSLAGKVIYIVDVRWPYTEHFAEQLWKVLSELHPEATFVLKKKAGSYMEDDPKLWSEVQESAHGCIITVGH